MLIELHVALAVVAVAAGALIAARRKGTVSHKRLGWLWLLAMAVVVVTSFGVRELRPDSLSPIHILSVWTAISMGMGVAAIRAGNVKRHRRWMGATYAGLIAAGIFAFAPGRELGEWMSRLLA